MKVTEDEGRAQCFHTLAGSPRHQESGCRTTPFRAAHPVPARGAHGPSVTAPGSAANHAVPHTQPAGLGTAPAPAARIPGQKGTGGFVPVTRPWTEAGLSGQTALTAPVSASDRAGCGWWPWWSDKRTGPPANHSFYVTGAAESASCVAATNSCGPPTLGA